MDSLASRSDALIAFIARLAELGRKDAHARRVTDRDGKASYLPAPGFPSNEMIEDHLSSKCPIGIYLMDGRMTRCAVFDLDDHDGSAGFECIKEAAAKICAALRQNGIRPLTFISGGGHGIHIWMAWRESQVAKDVRELLQRILGKLDLKNGTKGVAYGTVEIFPKQDEVGPGRFGNLIAMPLARSSVALSGDKYTPIPTELFSPPSDEQLYSIPLAPISEPSQEYPTARRSTVDQNKVVAALTAIPPDDYDDWYRIGIILKCAFGEAGLPIWNEWSKRSTSKYPGDNVLEDKWSFFPTTASMGLGTLFYMARERGWAQHDQSYASFVMSARELGNLDIPARNYIVEPFLPERGLAMIWAERGIGKTWIALCLALAIARGEEFLAYEVTAPRSVLYIDGEMPLAELKERLKLLCPELPENLFVLSSETLALKEEFLNISLAEHRARVEETLVHLAKIGHPNQVIILDNLSSLTSGIDENSNSDQDEILRWLIRLRHLGHTVVLVHHAGKSGQQRGASRREDILDTSIKLEIPKDEEELDRTGGATFTLSFTKTRGKTPIPDKLVLRLRENSKGQLEFSFEKSVVVTPYIKTLKVLGEGVSRPPGMVRPYQTQAELMTARKVTKGTISKHMSKLADLGLAVDAPKGLVVTPKGAAQLSQLFGLIVPNSLMGDPHSQDEIPF